MFLFSNGYKTIIFYLFIMLLVGYAAYTRATPLQCTKIPDAAETTLVHSSITQQDYRIYTSIPKTAAPTSGYPVIYMLDGHLTFFIANSISQLFVKLGMITPVIVVGIDYRDEQQWKKWRASDYTPTHNTKPVENPLLKGEEHGGNAAQFLQVITTEIKPAIEQKFPIDKKRQALFGHSYGGLFTLYAFLTKPNSFNYYFAASPSIWWDDHVILQKLEAFIQHPTTTQEVSLIISVGALEQSITDQLPPARKEKLLTRKQVTNAQFFINKLKALHTNGINSQFILFSKQNHATVIPLAIQQALLNFFRNSTPSHPLNQS